MPYYGRMSIAIIGIGIPGSGKTTILQELAATLPATYVCPDDIRAQVSGGDPANHDFEETVWALARIRALQALEAKQHVIVDATFTRKERREEFAQLMREGGATQVIGAYAQVTQETARLRNQERERSVSEHILERKFRELTEHPPTLEEGFDAIVPIENIATTLTPGAL